MTRQLLYLARRGQTALNAEGRLRGLANPPLDDVGLAEAHALGAALADVVLVQIWCSPLQRAISTAQAVSEAATIRHELEKTVSHASW